MKKYFFGGSLFALLFLSLSAHAASKWWDVNGATAGSGQGTGTGTWNTTGFNWTTDSNGLSSTTTFATGDLAIFSAGTDATNAFTVNAPSAITSGGITVEEGAVTLSGAAITIGTNVVTVNSGASLAIPGSSTLAATAGATIVLNGGLIQNNATGNAGSFVSPVITIILNGGGTLSFPTANILNIVQTGTPGTTISGTGPLTKTGAGVLAIATTGNTWTGGTIVNNGELRIRTSNNTLPISTDVTITSPGILNLNGLSQTIASLTGTGNVGTGTGALTINGSTSTTFNGALSNICNAGASGVTTGNGKLTKAGTGTITFAGPNDINGNVTLTSGGIVVLTNASLCGPICDLNVNGGTLALSNAAQKVENLSGTGGTIGLGPNHTLTSVPSVSATCSSVFAGPGNLVYSSPAGSNFVLTLNAASTYTGTTTVTAGTLALGASGSINGSVSISVAAGAGIDVSARSSPVNLSTNTTLIASGTGTNVNVSAANLVGPSSGIVSLRSQPIVLNYDGSHPALFVSQGTLSLSNNPFTINTASPLAHGTYLIAQQASNSIVSMGTFAVNGTAIAPGDAGTIQISGGNVNLVVATGSIPPANISGLQFASDGTALLGFLGAPNQKYIVQSTTNLAPPVTWTSASTNTSDITGMFFFNDTDSTNAATRFYRTSTP